MVVVSLGLGVNRLLVEEKSLFLCLIRTRNRDWLSSLVDVVVVVVLVVLVLLVVVVVVVLLVVLLLVVRFLFTSKILGETFGAGALWIKNPFHLEFNSLWRFWFLHGR